MSGPHPHGEPNPFLGPDGKPRPPAPPAVTIPFSDHERRRIAATGTWMLVSGILAVVLGLVTAALNLDVQGFVRAALWIAIGVLTILPSASVRALARPGDDLPALERAVQQLRTLFAVKAGCALVAITAALLVFRTAVLFSVR